MNTLLELYNKHKKGDWPDKNSVHSYLPVYEEIFAPYRHTAKNILEIGLMSGESLRMWTEYFDGKVYGIDCSETPINGLADLRPIISEGKHNIIIGDATSEEVIENNFKDIKFDIVIDDGSHLLEHQIQTINIFKNRMVKGGLIILEDIQNIDKDRWVFDAMSGDISVQVLDRRNIKGRYDDCLVILKF